MVRLNPDLGSRPFQCDKNKKSKKKLQLQYQTYASNSGAGGDLNYNVNSPVSLSTIKSESQHITIHQFIHLTKCSSANIPPKLTSIQKRIINVLPKFLFFYSFHKPISPTLRGFLLIFVLCFNRLFYNQS